MTRVAAICEKSHELDTCRSDWLSGCNAHRGLRDQRAARQCKQHPAEYWAGAEDIRSGRKYAAAVPGRLRRRAGRPVSRMESRGGVQSPARRDDGEAALSENGG